MRRILFALALLLAPSAAQAATCTSTGSGTWTAIGTGTATWTCSPPTTSDTMVIDGETITVPAGSTVTGGAASDVTVTAGTLNVSGTLNMRNVKATTTGAIAVASAAGSAAATINVTGCTSNSFSASPACGGYSGTTFSAQGAVIHDSATSTNIWSSMSGDTTNPERMTINLSAVPAGGAPLAGDMFFILSGVDAGAVYEVLSVGACSTTCSFVIRLYDADMEYGKASTGSTWNNASTGALYLDNTTTFGDYVGFGDQDFASYATADSSRYVSLCHDSSGTTWQNATGRACAANSTLLAESGAYSGWYIGLRTPYYDTAATNITAAKLKNKRYLIANSLNNVNAQTYLGTRYDATPLVDLLLLAESPVWDEPRSSSRWNTAIVWPGFWNLDEWRLWRPAKFQYTGTEGNGLLGFYGETDIDYAYFEDFFVVEFNGANSSTTSPINNSVVVPFQDGASTSLTLASAGIGCEAIATQFLSFPELRMDGLKVVDSRTALDSSATCCVVGGGGASCAGGAGTLAPGDNTSSTHGVRLALNGDVTIDNLYCRYLGDDCIVIDQESATAPTAVHVYDVSAWWMRQGVSANLVDVNLNAVQPVTLDVDGFRVVNYTGASIDDANCGYSSGSGITHSPTTASYQFAATLRNGIYIDTFHQSPILEGSAAATGLMENVYGIGRDQDGDATSACSFTGANMVVRHSWFDGWTNVSRTGAPTEVSTTFWRASPGAGVSPVGLGGAASLNGALFRDNVFLDLPAQIFASATHATEPIRYLNNILFWKAPGTFYGMGAPYSATNPPDIQGNVIGGVQFANCGATPFDGSGIFNNYVFAPTGAATIVNNQTNCTGMEVPRYVSSVSAAPFGMISFVQGARVGPRGSIGVVSDLTRFGLWASPLVKLGGGGGGSTGWLPKAF